MTTIYIITALFIAALIGAAIRHLAPIHRHMWTRWHLDSTCGDDLWPSKYETWTATCSGCGLTKRKTIRV